MKDETKKRSDTRASLRFFVRVVSQRADRYEDHITFLLVLDCILAASYTQPLERVMHFQKAYEKELGNEHGAKRRRKGKNGIFCNQQDEVEHLPKKQKTAFLNRLPRILVALPGETDWTSIGG